MLFPKEIFDYILSFIITPVPFKIGETYYVSYLNVWFEPVFFKIKIERVLEYIQYSSVQCIQTSYIFDKTYNDGWDVLGYRNYKRIHFWKENNAFKIEITMPDSSKPIILCSRHSTDEAKAINILVSRLNRYSDWFEPVERYCKAKGIAILP
jgi:hypothetical protein